VSGLSSFAGNRVRSWRPAVQIAGLLAVVMVFGCAPGEKTSGRPLTVALGDRRAPVAAVSGPTIRLAEDQSDRTRAPIEVVGLSPDQLTRLAQAKLGPEEWHALLAVRADFELPGSPPGDRSPILGSYRVSGNVLQFVPRFPLERGLRYRVVFDPARLPGADSSTTSSSRAIVTEFALRNLPAATATTLARVYPSSRRLPANLLKLYLHFSAPMSRGEIYQYMHLQDSSGKVIDRPFLEIGEELWDPSGTRLTLFFDPGRIKKGLRPREELGPILEEGKAYVFTVDRAMPDAEGNPLGESFRKEFVAGADDESPPEPKRWKLAPPRAGTRSALLIEFPEPLDRAMLDRSAAVTDERGVPLHGQISVEADETRWRFVPEAAWKEGEYQLVVDTTLEDLAGNSVGRPFEVDEFRPVTGQVPVETVAVPFQVMSAGGSGP
jgi:hypothetical protein